MQEEKKGIIIQTKTVTINEFKKKLQRKKWIAQLGIMNLKKK